MKYLAYFLLLFLPLNTYAEDLSLEIRGVCFNPISKKTREVFSQAWIDFETIAAMRVNPFMDVWTQVGWMIKKGSYDEKYFGHDFHDHMRAWVVPVNVGVRAYYPLNQRLTVYAGGGIGCSFLKLESHPKESFVGKEFKKDVNKNTFSAIAKLGATIDLNDNVFLDVFADYIYQDFRIGKHRSFEQSFGKHFDASGFKFGGGFGVYF